MLMEDVLEDFGRTVEEASARLLSMSDAEAAARPAEGKWSAKEVIGHLIDSATNNHQRFVRAQFKDDLVFDGYAQEDWVRAQGYQDEPWPLLVNLWRFYNLHLAHVCRHAPEAERLRPRREHNLHEIGFAPVSADEPATLEHLMRDYVDHLKSHLRQILGE
ncbi:MAG TPA: DinB family protein [Pyrinomonadaceae bacterium]